MCGKAPAAKCSHCDALIAEQIVEQFSVKSAPSICYYWTRLSWRGRWRCPAGALAGGGGGGGGAGAGGVLCKTFSGIQQLLLASLPAYTTHLHTLQFDCSAYIVSIFLHLLGHCALSQTTTLDHIWYFLIQRVCSSCCWVDLALLLFSQRLTLSDSAPGGGQAQKRDTSKDHRSVDGKIYVP